MSNLGLSAPITPTVPPQLQSVPSAEDLTRAFEFFNETSSLLSKSYRTLEGRVAQLTRELTEVSQAREEEHVKNHRLAERIQALLDFLPGGVIVLDERGFIVQSNPAAKSMLENPLDGFKWRDIISQCFAPRSDDGLEVSTHQGKRISIATASFDQTGQIILLTDQTETRRLQQQVARYEKLSAMGKMVSALAHQIRTPLSAALLYSNHLCNESLDSEKRQAFAHKLLGRLQHMERQVRDMLLFVRNELPLNEVITLADLQTGLQEAMEVPLGATKSFCIWINPEPRLQIRCNREALISAVLNLVNNAVQAKPGGNLAMRLEPVTSVNGLWLRLSVVDDGPGMSKELITQAKELFFTTKPQGTGLGLAVVQSVARAHGGRFHLQSTEGKGTQASLILPLV
ncbi:MAG: ATP-binding protein [Marinagarivorans sp.]